MPGDLWSIGVITYIL